MSVSEGLHVQESGPSDAPTILFLHGGGGAGWMWRPQVEALCSHYHCLVPDLPGQGRSADAGPFTMTGAAQQMAELIGSRTHGGRAHVVGLSEGAQTTLALLAIAPELVDRAVVSSALVRPIPGAGMLTPRMVRLSYRTTVAPLRNNDSWIRLNMRRAAGVPDAYFEDFRESFKTLSESGFTDLMIENQRFRMPEGLGRVKSPTLVVVGAREYRAMLDSAADIAAAIPGAKAYKVAHPQKLSLAQEHNWNMVAPDLFNATVRDWIEDRPLPAELVALADEPA